MIVYDAAKKVLDTESFPQHIIAGLIFRIMLFVLFSWEKPLRWKEINTNTHVNCEISYHLRARWAQYYQYSRRYGYPRIANESLERKNG